MSTRRFGQIRFAAIVLLLAMLRVQILFSMETGDSGAGGEFNNAKLGSSLVKPAELSQILQKCQAKYFKRKNFVNNDVQVHIQKNMFNNVFIINSGSDFFVDEELRELISDKGMEFLYCREVAEGFEAKDIDNLICKTFDDAGKETTKLGLQGLLFGVVVGCIVEHPIAGALTGLLGGTSLYPFVLRHHAAKNFSEFQNAQAYKLDEAAINKWDCDLEEAIKTLEAQEILSNKKQWTGHKLPSALQKLDEQFPFILDLIGFSSKNYRPLDVHGRKEKLTLLLRERTLRNRNNYPKEDFEPDLEKQFRDDIVMGEFKE